MIRGYVVFSICLCIGQFSIEERVSRFSRSAFGKEFGFQEKNDRLCITLDGQPIVDFVFQDDKIRRPYFANARLASGLQVTRNQPPIEGVDAMDHDTMHPGIWLAFGDLSQQDFWRNKGSIEHVRFKATPVFVNGRFLFSTECRLKAGTGESMGLLTNEFTLVARPGGWLLI